MARSFPNRRCSHTLDISAANDFVTGSMPRQRDDNGAAKPLLQKATWMMAACEREDRSRLHSLAAMSASLATVFMFRAVPDFAAGIRSFDRPMSLPYRM